MASISRTPIVQPPTVTFSSIPVEDLGIDFESSVAWEGYIITTIDPNASVRTLYNEYVTRRHGKDR